VYKYNDSKADMELDDSVTHRVILNNENQQDDVLIFKHRSKTRWNIRSIENDMQQRRHKMKFHFLLWLGIGCIVFVILIFAFKIQSF